MSNPPPEALMLLGTHCPFCPAVLEGLSQLVKQGTISQLSVVNIETKPDVARELNVRSVPWVRIGPFDLEGKLTPAELSQWAQRAASNEGIREYLAELLNSGGISKAEALIQHNPTYFAHLLDLFSDEETSLNIKVGIGALMEMFAESKIMQEHIDDLGELTRHANPRVRIDACHYLSLIPEDSVRQYIKPLLDDEDESVREVAQESLNSIETDL
jgi:hypothetical protein